MLDDIVSFNHSVGAVQAAVKGSQSYPGTALLKQLNGAQLGSHWSRLAHARLCSICKVLKARQ